MKTKKLVLTSLNPDEYEDLTIECKVVEDMKDYATALIAAQKEAGNKPKQVKKTVSVVVREGIVGEEVDTRPRVERDGRIYAIGETKGVVKVEGSMIVCNPDGEEYIVKPNVFAERYKPTSKPGVFKPIGKPMMVIEIPEDIAFKAPWGEDMFGVKGGVLNITDLDDIYAIQNEAFAKTYTKVEKGIEIK